MRHWQKFSAWLAGALGSIWLAVYLAYPTVTFNYRLTVEAMTPEGPKSGSTIIQVSYGTRLNPGSFTRNGDMHVTGEALYLDLGQKKNLFVLLGNDQSGRPMKSWDRPLEGAQNAVYLPVHIFGFNWNWGDEWSLRRQVGTVREGEQREVPLVALPTAVTFHNPTDPMSVALVDPRDISLNFGTGYSITSAKIELTNHPPQVSIDAILPWIRGIEGLHLNGKRYGESGTLPQQLTTMDFSIRSGSL